MHARFNAIAAFTLIFSLMLIGCGKPQDKIVGSWKVDIASLENDPDIKKLEGEAKTKALEMAKKMVGEMSFEFTKDGKMKMAFGEMKQEGTYTVKSTDGNLVTLETKMKMGEKEKVEEVKVKVDGGKLAITGPNGKEMIFVKK